MKIIFLDVDGVLNSATLYTKYHQANKSTDPSKMELDDVALTYIQKLVENTGAKIVLSSSWRIGGMDTPHMINLKRQLFNKGLEIYNCTTTKWKDENGNELCRGDQIKIWIDEYNSKHSDKVDKFVIIDDDSDMGEFIDTSFVHTSWENGMEEKHYAEALALLDD